MSKMGKCREENQIPKKSNMDTDDIPVGPAEDDEDEEPEEATEQVLANPDLLEITDISNNIPCIFCKRCVVDEAQYGKMYRLNNVVTHYYCVLFSSGLNQRGQEDHEGIFGFLEADILKEHSRGKRLKCKYCKVIHATVGCIVEKCQTSFHYTCGSDNGVLFLFDDPFIARCPTHRRKQWAPNLPEGPWGDCGICFDPLHKTDIVLCPPCCRRKVYHRKCLQKYGLSAGYYNTRCPNCTDEIAFPNFLRRSGVHLPDRDASWDIGDGWEGDYQLRFRCDAIICLCKEGREHDDEDSLKWDIIRCADCGSEGTHMRCSNLKKIQQWKCQGCISVLERRGRGPMPIDCQPDDNSSNAPGQKVQAEKDVHNQSASSSTSINAHVEVDQLVTKSPAAGASGTSVFYDDLLKKKYVVPQVIESESDSEDEIVVPETIISSKPLSVPLRARATKTTAPFRSGCNPNRGETTEKATRNAKLPPLPVSIESSIDSDRLSDELVSVNSPASSSGNLQVNDTGSSFDEVWTEIAPLHAVQVQSSPTTDPDPAEVPRKRKSDVCLANSSEDGNSPARNVSNNESLLSKDSLDEGRQCSSGINIIDSTRNAAPTPRSQSVGVTEFECQADPNNKRKKSNVEDDDDIRIIYTGPGVQPRFIAQYKNTQNRPVPVIVLSDDDDYDKVSG